jgi:hypothetical protein
MRMFVTVIPLGIDRVSGSAPKVPTKITLLTPRAMTSPHSLDGYIVHAPGRLDIRVSRCLSPEMSLGGAQHFAAQWPPQRPAAAAARP